MNFDTNYIIDTNFTSFVSLYSKLYEQSPSYHSRYFLRMKEILDEMGSLSYRISYEEVRMKVSTDIEENKLRDYAHMFLELLREYKE